MKHQKSGNILFVTSLAFRNSTVRDEEMRSNREINYLEGLAGIMALFILIAPLGMAAWGAHMAGTADTRPISQR